MTAAREDKPQSPRQELGAFVGNGRLRDALERYGLKPSAAAMELCIDVVSKYCEPRRKGRYRPFWSSK